MKASSERVHGNSHDIPDDEPAVLEMRSDVLRFLKHGPAMRAAWQPPQHVLSADDREQPCEWRSVDCGDKHDTTIRRQPGAIAHEEFDVSDVLDNLHVKDDVEYSAGSRNFCSSRDPVVNIDALLRSMQRRDLYVLVDDIDSRNACSQLRHGFGKNAAAAADVENLQAFKRPLNGSATGEMPTEFVLDVLGAEFIEFVQRPERSVAIPPGICEARVELDLARIDSYISARAFSFAVTHGKQAGPSGGEQGALSIICLYNVEKRSTHYINSTFPSTASPKEINSMAEKGRKQDHEYGIGAVAKLTGLTDHAIRVWERRYSAVVARRAANGRRVYGPADVEKLRLLKSLTDRGVSIGQIAGDTVDALRERVRNMSEIVSATMPEHVGVAVLGDLLPGLFADQVRDIAPVQVLLADSNRDTFVADLARHDADVVVVECPVLNSRVTAQLQAYMEQAGASKGVLVYNFGRSRDIDTARDSNIVALRSPVNVDEVRAAVMRAYTPALAVRPKAAPSETAESGGRVSGPIPPRRFNHQQLARLTRASTAIDCECPHHLAQLAGDLTAFEVYSAQCANRDEDDAELHRYLHQTTAQARALIEDALQRVAEAEGIDY